MRYQYENEMGGGLGMGALEQRIIAGLDREQEPSAADRERNKNMAFYGTPYAQMGPGEVNYAFNTTTFTDPQHGDALARYYKQYYGVGGGPDGKGGYQIGKPLDGGYGASGSGSGDGGGGGSLGMSALMALYKDKMDQRNRLEERRYDSYLKYGR